MNCDEASAVNKRSAYIICIDDFIIYIFRLAEYSFDFVIKGDIFSQNFMKGNNIPI